ncbi:DNA primase [Vibrio phage 393E50-1]|nr:DNA primase [Vibrio phage 393E50-1]
MYSPDEARLFIRALTGSDDTAVHFQCYFDPAKKLGLSPGPDAFPEEWVGSLDDSLEYLNYKQDAQCGVYVCINETDGLGREESNIVGLRTLMVDFDGVAEPEWKVTPHLVNMRDETHGHAFWLIESDGLDNDEWSIMQRRLALCYGTDTQVVDPCRVIRLPGSKHLKNPNNPAEYRVVEYNEELPRYTVTELRDAHMLPAALDAELMSWAEARQGILEGTGLEYVEHEAKRFVNFISNAAHPAVQGSGTHELYRVALYGRDHGLPYENATELLWEHYNPRCEPPWDDAERDHFEGVVYRAYKYATSAPGCRTFKSQLRTLTPIKEPKSGWETHREERAPEEEVTFKPDEVKHVKPVVFTTHDFDRGHRMSHDDAAVVAAQLTAKSPHYRFAEVFDGMMFDGINLIRNQRQFYRYCGDHWKPSEDDDVRAQIQRYFASFEPSHTFTNGIFKVYSDFVNSGDEVEVGKFMSNADRETKDMVVFKNGIVNFAGDEVEMIEHTPDFFNLHTLPHDYNPEAKCPTWLKFLDNIWDGDKDLITQLQMWFGYCLTSDVSLEKFALLKGASRSGKGTITTVLTSIIGDKSVCAPTLDRIHKDSSLSEMSKKALCLIPEAHDVNHASRDSVITTLKAVIGGDPVSYHEMYKGSQNAVFKTKIMISTNNVPQFVDASGALVNRMLVFPFYKSFAGKEDTTLKARLVSEVEGITQWAIEGLRMLRANNGQFVEADSGMVEKKEIREDMNPLSLFFSKMCEFDEESESSIEELYSAYRLWSTSVGNSKPQTMLRFRQMVRDGDAPVRFYDTGSERGFKGVFLKHDINMSNVLPGTFGKREK